MRFAKAEIVKKRRRFRMDVGSHKQRMDDIQKRKQERRKKQIFKNRCIAAVFCLLVLILMIFGVKSCVSGMIKSAQERKAAQITPSPVPTNTPIPKDASGIAQDFFKNSAFLGNSFIEGMIIYDLVDGADYFSKVGLTVKSASTTATDMGTVPVIEELNSTKVYDKIFMMFGENEVGWPSSQTFADEYTKLVKKAKRYQPEAEIYLLSITPITEEVSEQAIDDTTNANIRKFNKLIKQVAEDEDVIYCDIYSAVVNDEGALPEDAATDGIHFDNEYYKKCLIYIQEEYSETTIEGEEDDEDDTSSSSSSSNTNRPTATPKATAKATTKPKATATPKATAKPTAAPTAKPTQKPASSNTNSNTSSGTTNSNAAPSKNLDD